MTTVATNFGHRLKELREEAGLSQNALAKAAGLTRQAINRIESGDNEPSWESAIKLARALGIGVEQFDTGEDPRELDEPPPPLSPAKKPTPKKPKR